MSNKEPSICHKWMNGVCVCAHWWGVGGCGFFVLRIDQQAHTKFKNGGQQPKETTGTLRDIIRSSKACNR